MTLRVVTAVAYDWERMDRWFPRFEATNIPYTIYEKQNDLRLGEERHPRSNIIQIPNIGRSDYAFLYHIIQNYDCLDDVTLFVKNNWYVHNIDFFGHLQRIQTAHYDYFETGTEPKFQYWSDEPGPYPRNEEVYKDRHAYAQTAIDWFREVYPTGPWPTPQAGWGQGPCFSVSRELIRRHPKSVYEHMITKFFPESGAWDVAKAIEFYPNMEDQLKDVWTHFHDNFGRFWRILFTHGADPAVFTLGPSHA
jgi:hypothetical protein